MVVTPTLLRLIFAVVYITVDLVYVVLSRSFYEGYAIKIQGRGFPASRALGGVLAYVALVIGWWFFATRMAEQLTQRMHPLLAGALAGALYGFVVYGVFNGTMYVMFKGYDERVLIRDLLWGVLSAGTITALYVAIAKKYSK